MPELPSGTVTFLFTDIEGSTRLWEQHPEAMGAALARHDALVSERIQRHGGAVIKSRGEGDSLFAVFTRASDAVHAAIALQGSLFAEPWPPEVTLRVRMALHTGDAAVREGDYLGPAVNRCARLRAVAHGGQVLLSGATQELVQDHLPPEVSLRDLGGHRLRDLQRAEHVFQLLHPELPADFPPVPSLDVLPNNLPQQVTSFVGRETEIAELKALLTSARLLTLTGAGGCGKTRLALQVAAELLEAYADGVWLAELAAVSDPVLVPQTVAAALKVREARGRPLMETLIDHLRVRSMLLVLDNCEHLSLACARLAEELLRHCPHLRILATSREMLSITGERTYRVPSLSLPPLVKSGSWRVESLGKVSGQPVSDLSILMSFEAVQLFVDRAGFSHPRFALTDQNAAAVAQVCHRLDGVPLAIELAAALVRALTVEQIAARLQDRFRLLTGGSRTALPRQQTLRATMDWSYDLLAEPERVLLRRLSVFAGAWSLEAAEAICAGDGIDERDMLPRLVQLVSKSLVVHEEEEAQGRYRMLETVRQYGRERLLQSGEVAALRTRHRDWFLQFAERTALAKRFDELEQEHDNLRAALEWSIEQGEAETGLRLGAALGLFWYYRGHLAEGWERLAVLLALARPCDGSRTTTRATALNAAAVLAAGLGDAEAARTLSEESLGLWREVGDPSHISGALATQAGAALNQGDLEKARSLYEESLAIRRELGSPSEVASSLLGLGHVARFRMEYEAARALYSESLTLGRQLEDGAIIAWSLLNLGHTALNQGDLALADSLIREGMVLWREQRNRLALTRGLELMAQLAGARGHFARLARLFGAAEAQREAIRSPLPPVDQDDYKGVAAALAALGEAAFAAERAEGRALSFEQAIEEALRESDQS